MDPHSSPARAQIEALFAPRSVVVVGASSDPARVAGRPLSFLRDWEFGGEIAVVNPRRDSVLGYPSHPTVGDVPFGPDLAIVCLPAGAVLEALEQCAERGVRAAVVFAAGFAEIADGCPDGPAIRALAERTGMAICGPNCLGTISVDERLPATFSSVLTEVDLRSSDVALVTQSGALGIYLYAEAARRGLGFSRWVSTGNEAALSLPDYLEWLAQDERTEVICAYVEGVRDGERFRQALAAAAECDKPVIVLKGGRSDDGAAGVSSHTGAIAGDATVFSGILASTGAHEVDDPSELLEVAALARLRPRLSAGRGVAFATTSGGAAILAADWLDRLGLRLARLTPATVAAIEPVIPPFGRADNPVDFTGNLMNDPGMVRVCAEALAGDPDVGAVVVFAGVGGETAERVTDALLAASTPPGQLMAVIWIGASESVRQRLGEGGIPLFSDIGPCVRALARLWEPGRASAPGASRSPDEVELVPEHEAKRWLRDVGLETPRGQTVEPSRATELELDPLGRFAVKGQATGIAHKAAHGLVRLGCAEGDVANACSEIADEAAAQGLELEHVLVEEMVAEGVELLVTLRNDATFGWVVLVGSGGAAVERMSDVVARPCPLTHESAQGALDRLAVSAELDALPDPAAARSHACSTLVALAGAADQLPNGLVELELNPVVVSSERAVIVDAVGFLQRRES